MGFWHTGYIEFHESIGLGDSSGFVSQPVRYACKYCSKDFDNLEDLRRHRFEEHPLRQPVLLLRGRPVGTLPLQLMTPLATEDVKVQDAKSCRLNGDALALKMLGRRLAAMRREYVELELLSHNGVISRHILDFRVADEAQLVGVETAFWRMAQNGTLNLEAISRFNKECRSLTDADLYYDGICHYLYGVMAKERASDSGLSFSQYTERYQRASEALAGFDRPLARSIRALVAFHFNHFHDAELLASDGALRQTAGAFATLLDGLPWHLTEAYSPETGGAVEDLLTDQETLQVLNDASRGLLYLKVHATELLAQVKRMSTGYDRLKRILLAGEALTACDDEISHAEARKLARELVGQADAGAWAETLLKRMRP
ncbi:MAG: hypothetical protein KBD39_01280 [Sterolibacterium sp.]|nr:hypothetical protein [Sterolibacterium sp.]MBP9798741.1 hypothetical protein [Sterolibacterium sp.]